MKNFWCWKIFDTENVSMLKMFRSWKMFQSIIFFRVECCHNWGSNWRKVNHQPTYTLLSESWNLLTSSTSKSQDARLGQQKRCARENSPTWCKTTKSQKRCKTKVTESVSCSQPFALCEFASPLRTVSTWSLIALDF